MKRIARPKIKAFWDWFKSNSGQLAAMVDTSPSSELAAFVAPRVHHLSGRIGWEFGPGVMSEYAFSLTFNGCRDTIPLVEEIVSYAPHLKNWEINCGRPPKVWDGRFTLKNLDGEFTEVDSSLWSYILTAYDCNSFFDVELIGDLPPMDEAARIQACEVVVQAQLGERETLELIDRISITTQPTDNQLSKATSTRFLREHILSLGRPDS